MEYNEQAFKEKANLKAMKVWLALIAIMTLSYGSDLSKGIYTATQYVVFLVISLKLRIFAAVVVVDVANMLSFLITTINCDIFIS